MDVSSIPVRANGERIVASWFNVLRTFLGNVVDASVTSSAQELTDGGSVTVTANLRVIIFVDSDGGEIDLANTPFGTDSSLFVNGMEITLVGTSDTDYPILTPNDTQYGVVSPTGAAVLQNGFSATYIYNSTLERFYEKCRNS